MTELETLTFEAAGAELPGDLALPPEPIGTVVFAHGSGSSRHSPRNRAVAEVLNGSGLATLLFDLLTVAESGDRSKVFDIELLAQRLAATVDVVTDHPAVGELPVGLFGASTGAAAALDAAAARPDTVAAVVSRGGRPDLSTRRTDVAAAVLLIVGGDDEPVLTWNRNVADEIGADVAVIPGAGHLFEGPGELDRVAELAGGWFRDHLGSAA